MNKDGTTGMPCWKKLALAGSCVLALSLLLCFGLRLLCGRTGRRS